MVSKTDAFDTEKSECMFARRHIFIPFLVILVPFTVIVLVSYNKSFVPATDVNAITDDEETTWGIMEEMNPEQLDWLLRDLDDSGDSGIKEHKNVEAINGESCIPQQNIVFIKTHKTGSSTITNILNRYADLHELSVVLPAMGDVRFAWPRKFHWSSVDLLRLDGQPANMLVNHARYDRQQMDLIMEENSKYVTILRNPITQFESSFYYFEFDRILHLQHHDNPIKEFLTFPDEQLYNLTLQLNDLPDTMNLIQSGMLYDLGFDFMDVEPHHKIKKVFEKLKDEFGLILLMEYFDESLILLKNEFCWEIDDILYIKQNQRNEHVQQITKETEYRIKEWNRADVMLYEYFNKTFWKKVEKYGKLFWKDVDEFRRRNKEFTKVCSLEKIVEKGFKINVNVSTFVMNTKVDKFNRYLCEKLLMTEVDYLTYFRRKFSINFGYQKILKAEGIKPSTNSQRLQKRLKKAHMKTPKFFIPGEI